VQIPHCIVLSETLKCSAAWASELPGWTLCGYFRFQCRASLLSRLSAQLSVKACYSRKVIRKKSCVECSYASFTP